MTFRVRHEWPAAPTRLLSAELVSCPHCGTVRVSEVGRATRYLRRVSDEKESDREAEPPCIEPFSPRSRASRKRDRIGCELSPRALERATREAIDRARDLE